MDLSNLEKLPAEELVKLATLLEQQERAYDNNRLDLYKPHNQGVSGGQEAFHRSNHTIRLAITGNRWGKCVTFKTLIESPFSEPRPVGEIKGFHWVWAWDGQKKVPALAYPPFKKPAEECFRVWTEDGKWFECAGNHRVLTRAGWQFFSQLQPFLPALPASSSELGLLTRIEDVRHYLKKVQDLKGHYSEDSHQRDEPLPQVQGSAPASFPSRDDAPPHIFPSRAVGVLASRCASTLSEARALLSNQDGGVRFLAPFAKFLVRADRKVFESHLHSSQKTPLSPSESSVPLPPAASKAQDQLTAYALVSPEGCVNRIVAWQSVGTQDIYDFTVPIYKNYCTQGTVHHNTTASVMEAIWLCLGIHPYHPFQVPCRGKLYGESYAAIMEIIKPKFDEWLPTKFLHPRKPYERTAQGHLTGINFANGSIIRFGTYDQSLAKAEGSNWHFVGFDEPPPRELFVGNFRGLIDFGGIMWFTCTPLKEPWIHDDLWVPGKDGVKPYIFCIEGTSDDNPNINKGALAIFLSELTDKEKETRYWGRFEKLQGLVIDTYEPRLSDIDPFPLTQDFVIYEGIDPHPKKPHAALWKAIDEWGNRFVVDELSCPEGIDEFGRLIAEKRRRLRAGGATLISSVADTSLNQKDATFRMNQRNELMRVLREEGETVMPQGANKKDWLYPGITKLKDLFRPVIHVEGDIPRPTQYVFRNCTKYKYELQHYQWADSDMDNAKPIAVHNEYIDCDRYIERLAPKYQTPGHNAIYRHNQDAYSRVQDRTHDLIGEMKRVARNHSHPGSRAYQRMRKYERAYD